MVAPRHPVTFMGWKMYPNDCMTKLNDDLVNCIEENAYSAKELFISNENNEFNPSYEKGKIVDIF